MNLFSISCALIVIFNSFTFFFLILKGKNEKSNVIWLIFCVLVMIWGIGGYKFSSTTSKNEAFYWWKIANIGTILAPIIFYQFLYTFLNLKKKSQKSILIIAYIFSIVFLIFNFFFPENFIGNLRFAFNQIYVPEPFSSRNPVYLFFYLSFYWFLLLYSFLLVIISFKNNKGVIRNQLKYFIIGCTLGWLGSHGFWLLVLKIDIYPLSNFLIAIYPFIIAYAILRYRLMDIHVAIKRYGVYSLATGLLASVFIILLTTLTKYLSDITKMTSLTITGISAIIITLLFNPLRNKIQSIIDKLFYKKTYDYYDVLQKISHEFVNTFNLEEIYNLISNTVLSTLGLQNIYLLQSRAGNEYQIIYYAINLKDGKNKNFFDEEQKTDIKPIINKTSDIITLISSSKDIMIKDELNHISDIKDEVIENINNDLKPFYAEAVLPIFIDDKLEYILILGDKTSGDILSNEDVKLLNTISNQASITIKKAQLHIEKARSERLAALGMMSATFAHEIKNPLTSIKTFAELIPIQYMDHEFRETFSKIVLNGVRRIDGLITDLLMFSSDKIIIDKREFDLLQYMNQLLDEMEINFNVEKKKVVNIEKNYKDANIYIFGDEKKLRQVFVNLITNAFEAIPNDRKDGLIKVNIQMNEKFVDVFITDNGTGIALEDKSKLFEPFFTKKATGVGLGLVITKKIIDAHDGKINVTSTFKQGTTFIVSLPI
ncbi:MAG: hypothetical protein HY934_10960 [Candidatus Firestonebacteria bacterium]|nr:hypothetical protein [Candidatus Firestonebacteria bacterium]